MRENLEDHRGHAKFIPIIYQEYFLFLNYQVQQCDESIRGRNGSQKDPPGAQHQAGLLCREGQEATDGNRCH